MEYITFGAGFMIGVLCSFMSTRHEVYSVAIEIAKRLPFTAIKFLCVRFSPKSKPKEDIIDMWITKSGRREFRYTVFGRTYIVSCHAEKPFRKPSNIVSAIATGKNGCTWEVTKDIEERMGPQGDCHGIGGISIEWFDDAERVFVETLDSEFIISR